LNNNSLLINLCFIYLEKSKPEPVDEPTVEADRDGEEEVKEDL
jgi:hypothetical protein